MKAPITFAVLALHAAVITTILIGCNSTGEQPEVNPELANESAAAAAPAPATPPQEGSQDLRAIPTRPAQNLQELDATGYPIKEPSSASTQVNANLVETIPPAEMEPVKSEPAAQAEGTDYKVKAGDNLSKIAKRYGVSLNELLELNGLTRNSILRIGQTIKIPAGAKPAAETSSASSGTSALSGVATTGYVVQKGDSLSKLAIKFNTSVKKIMELNGLKSTNIRVGQKLKLPEAGSAAGSTGSSKSDSEALKGKRVHKIAKGETLGLLSKKYNISIAKLMDLNSIKDPRKIQVGRVLIVGEEVVISQPASAPAAVQATKSQAPQSQADGSQSAISVQPDAANELQPKSDSAATPASDVNPLAQPALEIPEIQEI